jgi:hypothetical protein
MYSRSEKQTLMQFTRLEESGMAQKEKAGANPAKAASPSGGGSEENGMQDMTLVRQPVADKTSGNELGAEPEHHLLPVGSFALQALQEIAELARRERADSLYLGGLGRGFRADSGFPDPFGVCQGGNPLTLGRTTPIADDGSARQDECAERLPDADE